jgi:hypothetical protein
MAYHDSELSDRAKRRMEKHLESCEVCRGLLTDLRLADEHANMEAGVNEIVGVPEMPAPDDAYWESFTARVLDRVEEDAATRAPEKRKAKHSWNGFIPKMAPAFSIALVIVVAAGVLMKIGEPVPTVRTPAPVMERPSAVNIGDGIREKEPAVPAFQEDESRQDQVVAEEKKTASGKAAVADDNNSAGLASLREEGSIKQPVQTGNMKADERKEKAEPLASERDRTAYRESGRSELSPAPEEAPATLKLQAAAPNGKEITSQNAGQSAAAGIPSAATGSGKNDAAVSTPSIPDEGAPSPPKVQASPPAVTVKDNDQAQAVKPVEPEHEMAQAVEPYASGDISKNAPARALTESAQPDRDFDTSLPDTGVTAGREDIETAEVPSMEEENTAPVENFLTDNGPGGDMKADLAPSGQRDTLAPSAGILQEQAGQSLEEAPSGLEEDIESGSTPASAVSPIRKTPEPARDPGRTFSSGMPYRGPRDQLTHAKNLADVRKFWESEQVLKDLLAQDPPSGIEQEASILLVKVLAGQNRIVEAQQTLEDAKRQFPASDMIQNYEIGTNGEKPAAQ